MASGYARASGARLARIDPAIPKNRPRIMARLPGPARRLPGGMAWARRSEGREAGEGGGWGRGSGAGERLGCLAGFSL